MKLNVLGKKSKGKKNFVLVAENEKGFKVTLKTYDDKIMVCNNVSKIEWLAGLRVELDSMLHRCGSGIKIKDYVNSVTIEHAKKIEDGF